MPARRARPGFADRHPALVFSGFVAFELIAAAGVAYAIAKLLGL